MVTTLVALRVTVVSRPTLPSLASRIPGISISFMSKGMGAFLRSIQATSYQ